MSHLSDLHLLSHFDQCAQRARSGRTPAQTCAAAPAIPPFTPLRLPTLRLTRRTPATDAPTEPPRTLLDHATDEVNAFAHQSSDHPQSTKDALTTGLRSARAERLELIESAPAPHIEELPALPWTLDRQMLEDLR